MEAAESGSDAAGMEMELHPGHRALRRGRWSLAGQIYLVSSVTRGRRPYFASFEAACSASRAMHAFGRAGDTALLAWVLMPDHAHWLLQLGGKESLPQAVNRLKATSARNANRWLDSTGPVWSPGFHDRALRRDDDLLDAARYVIANPLRAGLVRRIADYPFWDAVYLSERRFGNRCRGGAPGRGQGPLLQDAGSDGFVGAPRRRDRGREVALTVAAESRSYETDSER